MTEKSEIINEVFDELEFTESEKKLFFEVIETIELESSNSNDENKVANAIIKSFGGVE